MTKFLDFHKQDLEVEEIIAENVSMADEFSYLLPGWNSRQIIVFKILALKSIQLPINDTTENAPTRPSWSGRL